MAIHISSQLLAELMRQGAEAHPEECCGILFGIGDTITRVQPVTNVHPDPTTHFEIDPQALIASYRAEREGGLKVVGFYHSHPTGIAEPSATDAASAAGDGKIWAIIAGEQIALWRDNTDGFAPLSYRIING